MVAKSHGKHRKTRKKLRKSVKLVITNYLRTFSIGDHVAIKIESASAQNMPCRRFKGLTGKIIDKRGRAYIIQIYDGKMAKTIIVTPEHLKLVAR